MSSPKIIIFLASNHHIFLGPNKKSEIVEHLNVSIKSVEAHITKAFCTLRISLGHKTEGILFLLFGRSIKTKSFK
jgi:hypothetical protein